MSAQDLKSISNATGTFPTLPSNTAETPAAGKAAPSTGNNPPAAVARDPDIEALAAKLNVQQQSIGRDLRFEVDMSSGRSVIQVLDRETGEIIREIPPEKAKLSLSASGRMQLKLYDGQA